VDERAAAAALLACGVLVIACAELGPPRESPPSVPIGQAAPLALGKTLDDEPIDAGAFAGRVVVLNFWATWCAPCRKELPRLEELHRAYGDDGLEIIAVNFGERRPQVRKFLRANPVLTLRVALDPSKAVAKQYGVGGIPATVVVDWNGTVRWTKTGYDESYQDELLQQIAALVEEYRAGEQPTSGSPEAEPPVEPTTAPAP